MWLHSQQPNIELCKKTNTMWKILKIHRTWHQRQSDPAEQPCFYIAHYNKSIKSICSLCFQNLQTDCIITWGQLSPTLPPPPPQPTSMYFLGQIYLALSPSDYGTLDFLYQCLEQEHNWTQLSDFSHFQIWIKHLFFSCAFGWFLSLLQFYFLCCFWGNLQLDHLEYFHSPLTLLATALTLGRAS